MMGPDGRWDNLNFENITLNESILRLFNISYEDLDYMDAWLTNSGKTSTLSPTETPSYEYCGDNLIQFRQGYKLIHGYLSLLVCLFGCIANVLNIIVLTRPDMRSSTNIILTGLAVADCLVMLEYIPFSFHYYILINRDKSNFWSYGWTLFLLIHSIFSQVFHTISIC